MDGHPDPRYHVNFDIYEMVSLACWRAGIDEPTESQRFEVMMKYICKKPPTVKRLSGIEIDAAGLREYVKDGKVDYESANRDGVEYRIPTLEEALKLFAKAQAK